MKDLGFVADEYVSWQYTRKNNDMFVNAETCKAKLISNKQYYNWMFEEDVVYCDADGVARFEWASYSTSPEANDAFSETYGTSYSDRGLRPTFALVI